MSKKHNPAYMTRALGRKDGRFAVILGKMGYVSPQPSSPKPVPQPQPQPTSQPSLPTTGSDEPLVDEKAVMAALRDRYKELAGKNAFNGWSKDELLGKIVEFETQSS